ncbi:MerR family transcriptional regulator [Paenibacillus sp. MBLB4367]|uniref:MerR family transcriptional regulator n=1 Tax=Paenibacillus sp. MBLB4367 TaxID=3384767 RepID=UPI0039082F89
MHTFKIDDVAKECGLTKRTIRYYEEIGVLFPPERSEGGIRLYTQKHIERLKQIVNARDVLGFSLQEIQEFVGVSEELEERRQGFWEIADIEQRLQKLTDMDRIVSQQLQLIDQKLEKMKEIREQTAQYHERIRGGIAKLTSEKQHLE